MRFCGTNLETLMMRPPRQQAPWRRCAGLLGLCAFYALSVCAQEPAASPQDETQVIAEDAENSPAPPPAPPNQPVAERLAEQQRQLLSNLQSPPSSLWLPIDNQQVLAFWQPDRSGNPLGALLMLHDRGENPRRATTLRRLHEYLPIHGWATLSIELPFLPLAPIPARPAPPITPATPTSTNPAADPLTGPADADANPSEVPMVDEKTAVHQEESATQVEPATAPPSPSASREETVEQIHRRIQAAINYLQQQGQFNLVLLGEGSSAHWVVQHLERAGPPPSVESADKKSKGVFDRAIRAVILLNPSTPLDVGLEPLTAGLRHPDMPTFDVFTDFDLDTLASAQNRQQAAKQQGYQEYVVRRLPPPTGADPQRTDTLLTKAIRGFLEKHAKGVEMQ